ncbi:MAG: hypothetical protein ACFFEM_08660, partial [Candidatus Thorarchaeota archaeon]
YDSFGALEWLHTYGTDQDEDSRQLIQCSDGGFLLAGYGYQDSWIVRTDSDGKQMWNQTVVGHDGYNQGILELPSEEIIIAGSVSGLNQNEIRVTKLASNGSLLWTKVIDNHPKYQWVRSVTFTMDDAIVLMGHSYYDSAIPDTRSHFWMMKLNASGDVAWQKTFIQRGDQTFSSGIETQDGGFILVGTWEYQWWLNAGDKIHVIRTDSGGNLLWERNYTRLEPHIETGSNAPIPEESTNGIDIIECADNGYAILGVTNSVDYTPDNIFLVRLDSDGNSLWNQTIERDSVESPVSLIRQPHTSEFVILSRTTTEEPHHSEDILLTFVADEFPLPSTPTPTASGDASSLIILYVIVGTSIFVTSVLLFDRYKRSK